MKRERIHPRPNWQAKAEEVGFTYHQYCDWDESIAYQFSLAEVEVIEAATEELHRICLEAVDHVCKNPDLMDYFDIPADWRDYIVTSWSRRDPYVMGRFDLAYDPQNPLLMQPKMVEYNADTPTMVIESALVQWFWLQDQLPNLDQFNSLHEKLIEAYRKIGEKMPPGSVLHFSSLHEGPQDDHDTVPWSPEEYRHTMYFMDLAHQAGLQTKWCAITDVGAIQNNGFLIDMDNEEIAFWSKLYPWEWLVNEQFGPMLKLDAMGIIEPVWKMILSNKAILPILWKLFPGHPNLLPAYFEPTPFEQENTFGKVRRNGYVAKPILSREGANIEMHLPDQTLKTEGSYGGQRMIYQGYAELPSFDGQKVVIGSWVVGEEAAGMILRESGSPIVVNTSKIVPHFIRD